MRHVEKVLHVQQHATHATEPIDSIYRHNSPRQVIKTSNKEATQVVQSLSSVLHLTNMSHMQQIKQDDTHVRKPIDGIYRHLQVIETSKKEATPTKYVAHARNATCATNGTR